MQYERSLVKKALYDASKPENKKATSENEYDDVNGIGYEMYDETNKKDL